MTVDFENLPQVPFEDFNLHLFSSDRGLMATPTDVHDLHDRSRVRPLEPSLPEGTSSQVFGLESGPGGAPCPGQMRPFHPTLAAGTSNPLAGAFSAFSLKLNREDGDQYLGKLNFTMPPGLTANLHGVTYCPEADILAAAEHLGQSRAGESQLPRLLAKSAPPTSRPARGTIPSTRSARSIMSGPFQGAPLSLVAITPALAGPYDYGTVVVRVALQIDPHDAHVIADSETVPEIIGGIPIRMREIQVNIDSPNFMINPTNCSTFSASSPKGSATRARLPASPPTFTRSTARPCPSPRR